MTDILAILLGVSALVLITNTTRTNSRLQRENEWLRSRVRNLRKQVGEMVERPF